MVFHYKLNYYKSEDGEYTADAPCDKTLMEKVVADYWTGEHLPNGLELIVVWNDIGQAIMLEHSAKEVFEVYYLPLQGHYLYHKKSRIDLIYDTLTAFMDNDIHWLDDNLNRTTHENKRIRKDVLTQSFIYEVTPQLLWSAIGMTLATGLSLGVLFIVIWIETLIKATHSGGIIFMTILTAMVTWMWLPGVFLHFQYKKENEFLFLRLSRGEEVFWVDVGGTKKEFLKSNIASIERVKNPAYKLSWADYGYTVITLTSGEILIITNLMIDQFLLAEKFPEHWVSKTDSRFPWLKKRTSIQIPATV